MNTDEAIKAAIAAKTIFDQASILHQIYTGSSAVDPQVAQRVRQGVAAFVAELQRGGSPADVHTVPLPLVGKKTANGWAIEANVMGFPYNKEINPMLWIALGETKAWLDARGSEVAVEVTLRRKG